jgi:hypothetical protein
LVSANQSPERRSRQRSPRVHPLELRVSYDDSSGVRQVISAIIVDAADDGIGIQSRSPLRTGLVVALVPGTDVAASGIRLPSSAKVAWCSPGAGGMFRSGLSFEAPARTGDGARPLDSDRDHYDTLQLSPQADPDTIHRVFRILAQRYHPDNSETGSEEAFKRIRRAYEVLGDPASRASYDIQRNEVLRSRWRVFQSPESAQGPEAERRKRAAVLQVLYQKRLSDPAAPAMNVFEFEELLGIPRDHLEFTLWYLKERAFISRSDNNRFQITVGGVDHAESLEPAGSPRIAEDRLLPAANR